MSRVALRLTDAGVVIVDYVEPECDVCAAHPESVSWCGDCGCCVQHCQGFVDCSTITVKGSV